MYACERGTRSLPSSPTAFVNPTGVLATYLRGGTGVVKSALAGALALALTIAIFIVDIRLPDSVVDAVPVLGSAFEIEFVAVTLLLTATVIALLRAIRGRDLRVGLLKVHASRSDWLTVALLLGPFWILTVFHAAPIIGAGMLETVQNLPAPVWDIAYDGSTRTIRLSGEYGPGVADDFGRHLAAHPDVANVELSGPGGLLDEGIAIAGMIETRNLPTTVRSRCASACTFAFAGGRQRFVIDDGALGFHASRDASVLREWIADHADEVAFLTKHDYSADFVARIYDVPSYDIWYPTRDELRAAHVIAATRNASP
jgi:hypothetical protein